MLREEREKREGGLKGYEAAKTTIKKIRVQVQKDGWRHITYLDDTASEEEDVGPIESL